MAYVIPQSNYDKESLLNKLKEELPEYMIPSAIVEMEEFPMLASGKVDRKALPDPEHQKSTTRKAPSDETEIKLAEIWEEVLEVEDITIEDDFFELGGHSLLAIRLVSAIRKAFEVEMPIGDIFDYPTIAELKGQLVSHEKEDVLPPVEKVTKRPKHIPLSFSQERLWFIDKLEGSVQYHIPSVS